MVAWSKHLLQLALGLVLFGMLLYVGDVGSLERYTPLKWPPLLGAFAATFFIAGALAGRWGTITHALAGQRLAPWRKYLHYFLLSRSLGFILPKDLTDLGGRAAALNRFHGAPLEVAGASVLFDRLCDLITVALFLPPAMLYWMGRISAPVAIGLMVAIPIGFLVQLAIFHRSAAAGAIALFNWGIGQIQRVPFWRRYTPRPLPLPDLTGRVLLQAFLFSLAKFGATTIRLIFIAQAVQPSVPSFVILMGMPVGQLSYFFAVTPGGIGVFEAGWFAVLTLAGCTGSVVTIFLVAQRVITFLCVVGWALLSHFCNAVLSRTRDLDFPKVHAAGRSQ